MKNKINIFSNGKMNFFLINLLNEYNLSFKDLHEIDYKSKNTGINIIIIDINFDIDQIIFENLNDNYLIFSYLDNKIIKPKKNVNILNTPTSISNIKTTIVNFVENFKIYFHDLSIVNEKLININNNSFCYLTSLELAILSYLIKDKGTSKNFIRENILNIRSSVESNSLESHLTRIRKKMNKIKTSVKIQSKSENLLLKI
tara:strand:- start:587 stop:1189 length:603 start_codon:yes stop_codon:yes gene_type:complete